MGAAPARAYPPSRSFAGTIYFSGGNDELNAELFQLRGSRLQRITSGGRVSEITGYGRALMVSNARRSGFDRLDLARLGARNVLPGTVINRVGQSPVYSASGGLLYTVPRYGRGGSDAGTLVYVSDTPGRRPRPAIRSASSTAQWGWALGNRVAFFEERSSVLRVRGSGGRLSPISSGLPRIAGFETSGTGVIAFASSSTGSMSFVEPGGAPRVLRTPWTPAAWSPDSQTLLVKRGRQLGLMAPATGAVTLLGSVTGGDVYDVTWVDDRPGLARR